MAYVRFDSVVPFDPASSTHSTQPTYSAGWDAWAAEYAKLGRINSIYALGKELLHELVDQIAPPPGPHREQRAWVLDVNCGAGDDLERFVARGWCALGCDGSRGMLGQARTRMADALQRGRAELWHGRLAELEPGSFGGRRFDLAFSAIGGFAYVDDDTFVRVHRQIASLLTPGGVLVLAHLTRFCAAESLYHLLRLRPRRAVQRLGGEARVEVRGEPMLMHLRSPLEIRRLLDGVVHVERMAPLLVCTPPFQTGFSVRQPALAVLRAVERRAMQNSRLAELADQVVCVARPLESSSNNAR